MLVSWLSSIERKFSVFELEGDVGWIYGPSRFETAVEAVIKNLAKFGGT